MIEPINIFFIVAGFLFFIFLLYLDYYRNRDLTELEKLRYFNQFGEYKKVTYYIKRYDDQLSDLGIY